MRPGDLDASSPWLTTPAGIDSQWEGRARVGAFVFPRASAQAAARRISGDDRLTLVAHASGPSTVEAGRRWERAYRYVRDSLLDLTEGVEAAPILEAELQRHALVATLAAFPTSFQDAGGSPQRRAAPAVVRRAMAYRQRHAPEPITIDDVAVAARISTRGLQYAFRRALGMSPTAYLREVRLTGAHEELRRGDSPPVGTMRGAAPIWKPAWPSSSRPRPP